MGTVPDTGSVPHVPSISYYLTTPPLNDINISNNITFVLSSNHNSINNSSNTSGAITPLPGRPLQWGMLGLTLIILCTAVGNLLVCLAVCWEKRLQNMTNYFLMSLAIADFLVSLLVMPLGMIVEIFGIFPMNPEVCVLWVASDVLMCSASIWHMCTMSMDRYFTLNYPMRYGRNKTRRMVAGKILFVWIVSMAISSPICIHGFIDTSIVFEDGNCVPQLKNFLIYGSIFAFYIPLCIMIVTYVLTIRILWQNQYRMKNIDRSDLKPRLAQLTAQCTGFAIPKLLANLKKPNKPPKSVTRTVYKTNAEKRPLAPGSARITTALSAGNINSTCQTETKDTVAAGNGGGSHPNMTYLTPPSPQTMTKTSTSPASIHVPINSDTDDSESEPNYFSLLQTSHSCRSLCTPISLSNSEKSLHRRLQKRQLYQQQQQELHQLRQEYHHQRQLHHQNQDTSSLSPSPPDNTSHCGSIARSTSGLSLPSPSSPASPAFDENSQFEQEEPLISTSLISLQQPSQTLIRTSPKVTSKKDSSPVRIKKKRYSKKGKKRRNSLTQQQERRTQHLEVPCQVYFRRGRPGKQTNGLTGLSTAVSDTQVSQAGRGVKSDDEGDRGVSSFHLSYSNLNKDYKSIEWDRRYFEIQEEMDQCLNDGFGRSDRRQSRIDADIEDHDDDDDDEEEEEEREEMEIDQKTFLKPESSLPVYLDDPLNVQGNIYSRSAPNSPLNRRSVQGSFKGDSSSDNEPEEDIDESSDKNSDKNNDDDDDNDTSESAKSDVITIRLHPPTPKSKNSINTSNSDFSLNTNSSSILKINSLQKSHNDRNSFPLQPIKNSKYLNGSAHLGNDVSANGRNNHNSILSNGNSLQSLSPVSSTLPELVISSEGEMTMEETDDTLDGSPSKNNIKLRRPREPLNHQKTRFRKKHQSPRRDKTGDKYVKSKRSSFRNTFRIHRGTKSVKHVLSKKTASNEKKASKVLGIIFLVFVVLWTPFFTVNILSATCASCISSVTNEMMSLFLWMGYIASLANPIIYTMFNTAFRRTFIRILTCKIQRTCRTATSDTHYMSYTTMLASERRNTVTVVLRDESR